MTNNNNRWIICITIFFHFFYTLSLIPSFSGNDLHYVLIKLFRNEPRMQHRVPVERQRTILLRTHLKGPCYTLSTPSTDNINPCPMMIIRDVHWRDVFAVVGAVYPCVHSPIILRTNYGVESGRGMKVLLHGCILSRECKQLRTNAGGKSIKWFN